MVRAPTHWWGDVSRGCKSPGTVTWQATRTVETGLVDLRVPCRKCRVCLLNRSRLWASRAIVERAMSERSWMVTLTYSEEPASPRHEITMWLQRVKRIDPSVRYLVVSEYGSKKGRLHHHALLHSSGRLTWRRLDSCWSNGFAKYNLAEDDGGCRYVTKYITKAGSARLRASRRYGGLQPP